MLKLRAWVVGVHSQTMPKDGCPEVDIWSTAVTELGAGGPSALQRLQRLVEQPVSELPKRKEVSQGYGGA